MKRAAKEDWCLNREWARIHANSGSFPVCAHFE
jgi:hypothetical protein